MLTICNTGSLATAGYGTALGMVRSVAARCVCALVSWRWKRAGLAAGILMVAHTCLSAAIPVAAVLTPHPESIFGAGTASRCAMPARPGRTTRARG